MSTLVVTLAIDAPPDVGVADIASAVSDAAFEAAEHVRKCDCDDREGCVYYNTCLDVLSAALDQEVQDQKERRP